MFSEGIQALWEAVDGVVRKHHVLGRVKSVVWTLPSIKSIHSNLTKADTQG